MYFRNKFFQKETLEYWLNIVDLSAVLTLKTYSFPIFPSTAF